MLLFVVDMTMCTLNGTKFKAKVSLDSQKFLLVS